MSIPFYAINRDVVWRCTGCGLETKHCDCGHRTRGTAGDPLPGGLRSILSTAPEYLIDKLGVVHIPNCQKCKRPPESCDCAELDAEIAQMKKVWEGKKTPTGS